MCLPREKRQVGWTSPLAKEDLVEQCMTELLQEFWQDWVGDDGKPRGNAVASMGHSLPRALLLALGAPRWKRAITKEVSLEMCQEILATIPASDTDDHVDADGGSLEGDQPQYLPQITAAPTGENMSAANPVEVHNRFLVNGNRPQCLPKRALTRPLIALIPNLTAELIEEGLQQNTDGGGDAESSVTLFVWHLGFAGSLETLRGLLNTLRRRRRLRDVCVLLLEGLEIPHCPLDAIFGRSTSQTLSKEARQVLQEELQVRVFLDRECLSHDGCAVQFSCRAEFTA